MSRELSGVSAARLKRFESDLRRKIPQFPIQTSETNLNYSDFVKIQKRAFEMGLPATYPNERLLWILKVLNNLEKWAAHIIPVNQSESVKDTIAYLKAAEQQFGDSFMKSVPLYRAIRSSNRKYIHVINEYENKNDGWLPKSLSVLPTHHVQKIVSDSDFERILNHHKILQEISEDHFFSPVASAKALSLLTALHPEDLKSNQSFKLLHQVHISVTNSGSPSLVRVESKLVSQLICIVVLFAAAQDNDMSISPKFVQTITRTIDEKIVDSKFKKSAEPFLNTLVARVFPAAVAQLAQLLRGKYGHPSRPRRQGKDSKRTMQYSAIRSGGMTTRQKQRLREESNSNRKLFVSPNRKIQKLLREATRLRKYDLTIAIQELQSMQTQLGEEETKMWTILGRTDVCNWDLETLVDWANQEHLYLLRESLRECEREILTTIASFKFNRNIIFYRKFIDHANENLSLLRAMSDFVNFSLSHQTVALDQVERLLSRFTSPPPSGIVLRVFNALSETRENIKLLSRKNFKSVSSVANLLSAITSAPSIPLPFTIDVSSHSIVLETQNFLNQYNGLKELVETEIGKSDFDSLNHHKLSSIHLQLTDLMSLHHFSLDQPSSPRTPPVWWEVCFMSNWLTRANISTSCNNVSDLIDLHQQLISEQIDLDSLNSKILKTVWESVESKIVQVQSVLDRIDKGEDLIICLNEVSTVSFSGIEKFRMLLYDYWSSLDRIELLGHRITTDSRVVDVSNERMNLSSVRRTLNTVEEFAYRFPKNKIMESENFGKIKSIVEEAESIGLITDRTEIERIITSVTPFLSSPDLDRVNESLQKVKRLETEISETCRKSPGTNIGDTASQIFSKFFDNLLVKYDLLKKVNRSKICVTEQVRVRLAFSLFSSITILVKLWTQKKRDLNFVSGPRWTIIYLLRSIGGYLGSSFKTSIPKQFSEHVDWLSKQLNASNEILKEAKKNVSEFARNRFLIPMFHFALYEPMEKIRKSFETKLGVNIKLVYKDNNSGMRILDYICTSNPQTGKVVDRFFPKPGSQIMAQMIGEPSDTETLSSLFENRETPKNLTDVFVQLHALVKAVRDDVKNGTKVATVLTPSVPSAAGVSTPAAGMEKSKGPMSFTKFLSSSFSNIELDNPASEAAGGTSSGRQLGNDSLDDSWINNVDQIVGTGESNFFEKYMSLIEESKRARNMDSNMETTPPPVVPSKSITTVTGPPPSFAPPPISNRPGGIAPPPVGSPRATAAASFPSIPSMDKLVMWSGIIEGGMKQQNVKFEVSLIPLFRPLPPTDHQGLQQALCHHSVWSLEGSMGIGKFADYFQKLTAAANRRRREPYTFLLASKQSNFDAKFFDSLPMNTANAFAVLVPPHKLKLWVLSVDGSVDYKPLPILPGVVFGMVEIPSAVFSPASGYVENIYHPMEMNQLINQLNMELAKTGMFKSLYVSIVEPSPVIESTPIAPPPPVQQDQWLIPPTGPVALAVPRATGDLGFTTTPPMNLSSGATESLARVFGMIGTNQDLSPPPVYNPLIPPPSISRPPISTGGWSRPNIVIGAPSTGPTVNELPNPRKGSCRFFNTSQGCQQGTSCKFSHFCSVCGEDNHNAIEHYSRAHH